MTEPRTARINPDNVGVLAAMLAVLATASAASFTLSFAGLSAVAPWAAVPAHLAWLVPVALEVALVGYVLAAAVRMRRGESALGAWALTWTCTLASSALNALHAYDAGPGGWRGLAGIALAASLPLITLAAVHTIAGVLFARLAPTTPAVPTPHPLSVLDEVEVQHVTAPSVASLVARRAAARAEREARKPRPITDDQRARMRDLRAQGMTVRAIAAEVGVSKSAVSTVLATQPALAPASFELVQEVHTA